VAGLLAIFSVLYAVETIAFGSLSTMFDRCLWPLVVPLGVLLLRRRPAGARTSGSGPGVETARWRRARPGALVAGASLAVAGLISCGALLNSVAFDAGRWRIGEEEVGPGLPAMSVDAGFEWLGAHATDTAMVRIPFPSFATRYSRLWASYRQCVAVSGTRLAWPGLELAERRPRAYRMLLFAGAWRSLYIYRSSTCQPGSPDS
jgi:hypothetical protein